MAASEIATIPEIVAELGMTATLTAADEAVLTQIKGRVEDLARRYVKHGIARAEYTVYLPGRDVFSPESREYIDVQNDQVILNRSVVDGHILQLPQVYVVNDGTLAVYEDFNAEGGQKAGDFAVGTLLTKGTDYRLDTDDSGELSDSGHLVRITGSWSSRARTIRATFNAGFTAAQLDSTYRDIKDAIINEVVMRFRMRKSQQGGGGGAIKGYSIGGQVSVTYDTSVLPRSGELADSTKASLRPYKRIAL